MPATILPEQGQLVTVRQRRYVVSEVAASTLAADPLRPAIERQHLVTLQSVEDEGLGEELQVIWELEPGARTFEHVPLPEPTGFDDPETLEAFLNAIRWGAVSSADTRALQAPFRAGIDLEDYQLDPVVRAIQMPRVNLLIADDVGLGKTIEAGLVVQELLLRHRARTVLVVCPSSLQIQWRDQMRDKFGLEFRIVDSALLKELRRKRGLHANPWTHFPRLITSIDFLKRERPLRLFREALPRDVYPRRFDVLVVDEAHCIAPSGTGAYATDSLRTQAVRTLAPHFEHRLFLTATPHNGYANSFSALLEILDNQRFARGVSPTRAQLGAVMVRRLKSELPPLWDGTPRFPTRDLEHPIRVPYPDDERACHQWLRRYTDLRLAHCRDHAEEAATRFVLKTLKKRLFSSPAAFLTTLEKHQQSLHTARRATVQAPPLKVLARRFDDLEDAFDDDEQLEQAAEEVVEGSSLLFRALTEEEVTLLQRMSEYAHRAVGRSDAKARELIAWLRRTLLADGCWNDRRVIIFTEYRATQKWLLDRLAAERLTGGDRIMTLYGGMDSDQREAIKAAFQAAPEQSPVRILLSTDAASEGIDLQNHCARLIHYEIPWNPNRLEQRNGRIDRHGQKGYVDDDGQLVRAVLIHHFVAEGFRSQHGLTAASAGRLDADLEFLWHAARKVETIREDLGKVGPVLAQQVEEAMLGRRTQLDTATAEHGAQAVRRMLKLEREVQREIAQLVQQLDEARRGLQLAPAHVERAVCVGLRLADKPALIPDAPGTYRVPPMDGSWARCRDGLLHPHTRRKRPITFDERIAHGRDDVVLAHLNHRLVAQCLALLRAQIWAADARLHRVCARLVPDEALDFPAVLASARLLMIGGDFHRLHEELIVAGGTLREGRFTRLNVGECQRALEQATLREPAEGMKHRLAELWPRHRDALKAALSDRTQERAASLGKKLRERSEREVERIRQILEELRAAIERELHAPPVQQLVLPIEIDQRERDVRALQARLDEIPREIEKETAAVRARFSDPTPRLFPVAVTWLVPEKFAQG